MDIKYTSNKSILIHTLKYNYNALATILTVFFKLCQIDPFATTLFYSEMPCHYIWNISKKKNGMPVDGWSDVTLYNTLDHITEHISNFEYYCLRLLLHQIKEPINFNHLRTIIELFMTSLSKHVRH